MGIRQVEPLQLPEQSGEVQGRRREARVHPQGVSMVLYDVTDTARRRGGAQEPQRETAGCHLVAVWVSVDSVVKGTKGRVGI